MTELACPGTVRSFEEPPIGYDDLVVPFLAAEKPAGGLRVGVEAEKFGLLEPNFDALPYAGARSVSTVLSRLHSRGMAEVRERSEGPVIALERNKTSITLEPGAQLELSGSPNFDLHAAAVELEQHHAELREVSSDLGIAWCSVGFHPLSTQEQLPWVPKLRYAIMREYLPTLGAGALDMMRRTATVQVNLDYTGEADAMRKLRLMLRLSPLVHALTSHSPIREGRLRTQNSQRGDVWTRMDPARSGLVERLWSDRELRYSDYIEWALDAGMFLFKRQGEVVPNTGQSFRDFLHRGFQGHRATLGDWRMHLNTLFPEARLKNVLEARASDAQPADTLMSVPALWVGLLYDPLALNRAEALADRYSFDEVRVARPTLIESGLRARIGSCSVQALADSLLEIAHNGLLSRSYLNAARQDETQYLEPLQRLVQHGETPADRLRRKLLAQSEITPAAIVDATRIA